MIRDDQTEPLAQACQTDAPGTAIERWRSFCVHALLAALVRNGRDVTIIVGRRTDRKQGQFHVVREEQRN